MKESPDSMDALRGFRTTVALLRDRGDAIAVLRMSRWLPVALAMMASACGGGSSGPGSAPAGAQQMQTLTVTYSGSGTITSSPSGIACGPSCTASYASGSAVTLTAQAASGYTFSGWSGACSGTGSCVVTMNAAASIAATFAASPVSYVLTVSNPGSGGVITSVPGGISCGSTCSSSYAAATAVTLTAQASTGYGFTGWNGACTGTATSCTVTMNSAQSVAATFSASQASRFALTVAATGSGAGTVTSVPAGINCGSACSSSYASGTVVTLTAQAASGSTFGGWSGACSGTGTCALTMNSAQSASATFTSSGGSAQNANSIVYSAKAADFTFWKSNPKTVGDFGNYIVRFDLWSPTGATQTMWINSATSWGAWGTQKGSATSDPGIWTAPCVTRGWVPEALSTYSTPGTNDWTTLSGLGLSLANNAAAITKANMHWSIGAAPTTPYPASRWDALIDVFFHTSAQPGPNDGLAVDLQIIPYQMDSYMAGSFQGLYGSELSQSGFQITLGSGAYQQTYSGVVNQNGPFASAYTVTMFVQPDGNFTNPNGLALWGKPSSSHDLRAIIQWLMQSPPRDNSGNPIKNWNYTGPATAMTGPVLLPSYFLTAVNWDFEFDYANGTSSDLFMTDNVWLSLNNEPDGAMNP